jgi:hypothetical protein
MEVGIMSSIFDYIEPSTTTVIETGMMRCAIKRTLAAHRLGGLCMWSGRAGIGKTTTAQYMVKCIEEDYDPDNPRALRAVHYRVGSSEKLSSTPKHKEKHGIRSLYYGVGYKLDEGAYRTRLPEELAADLVHFIKKMNIQIIFPDEAGCLSLDAIRGIVLVSDTARLLGCPLTIVLIGMDNLPSVLTSNPQVERRVYEWCYFKPCTLNETQKLLAALHPYFASLNLTDRSHKEQIRYIHEECKGMPGNIVPFASRFGRMIGEVTDEDPMVNIQAALIEPLFDKERCIKDSQRSYSGELNESDGESDVSESTAAPDSGHEMDESDNIIKLPAGQDTVRVEDERHT